MMRSVFPLGSAPVTAHLALRFIEYDGGDTREFGADGEHFFDIAVGALYVAGEHGEEGDDRRHQFEVAAGAGVLGVLEYVGEEGAEGRDGVV